jgi:hypothetical protein
MGLKNENMINREILSRVREYNKIVNRLKNGATLSSDKSKAPARAKLYDNYINQGNVFNKPKRKEVVDLLLNYDNLRKNVRISDARRRYTGHEMIENYMNNARVLTVYKTELVNYLAQLYQFLKLYKRDSPSVERILGEIGIKPSNFEKIQNSDKSLKALEKRVKMMKTIKKSNSGNFSYRNNNISFSGLYLSDMLDRIAKINL